MIPVRKSTLPLMFCLWSIIFIHSIVFSAVKKISLNTDAEQRIKIWIYFDEKDNNSSLSSSMSENVLARRKKAGYLPDNLYTDLPVSPSYLRIVESFRGELRHIFKWDNAASFSVPASAIVQIASLPFVTDITLVGRYRCSDDHCVMMSKTLRQISYDFRYGTAFHQLSQLAIPQTHRYISYRDSSAEPGQGVRIAFFDSGFRLDHICFSHLAKRNAIKATYDFIDNDTSVNDPDSVNSDMTHPYWGNDIHGTQVLSLVAAYNPPYYCGAAWGADFILARTEDTYIFENGLEIESHSEEDNWAAAVVWAESLGVDIISSSLGYSTGFRDTVLLERADGTTDTLVDYRKSDMDGKTTIVSRAAQGAVERGVIIVNSAGNEQNEGDTSISAPADVEGVIAVGSVNRNGTLSSFSSLGPAANETSTPKPDLVAPGGNINLPLVESPLVSNYEQLRSGTSFAAPLVAGICALIKHVHLSITAEELREKLFKYCRYLPGQTTVDNRYGRGIPDALKSTLLHDNEVFISVMDTGGKSLSDRYLLDLQNDTLGKTDGNGFALLTIEERKSSQIKINYGNTSRIIGLDPPPSGKNIVPCSLTVRIQTPEHAPLGSVGCNYTIENSDDSKRVTSDTLGKVTIEEFVPGQIRAYISAHGFIPSDTLNFILDEEYIIDTVVTLIPEKKPVFEVFPTVLHLQRHHKLHIRFSDYSNATRLSESRLSITVRSLNGNLIWKESIVTDGISVERLWDGKASNGKNVLPGTYICIIRLNDKYYPPKKLIIAE